MSAAPLNHERAIHWFGSLWPHARAKRCKIRDLIKPDVEPCGFLLIEDFGTRGLEGDVNDAWPRENGDNHFFHFVRAEGLSGKSGTQAGSWGAGKSVFARSSRVNSYLALSVRRNTDDVVLTGKSVLWHHEVTNRQFTPYGVFGSREGGRALVMPCADRHELQRFVNDFGIRRPVGLKPGEQKEPGLSVVVPYADTGITAQGLLEVVVREYFYPILADRLMVTVAGPGLPSASARVDIDTISDHALNAGDDALGRMLELVRWSLGEQGRQAIVLPEPSKEAPPRWDDDFLRPVEAALTDAVARFARGDPVALRIPVRVHQKQGEQSEASHFDLFLQKDCEGEGYRPIFVRGNIVVPHAKHRIAGVLAIAVISPGSLFEFLRLAEPPAHEKWVPDTLNIKGRYRFIKDTIDYVTGAAKFLSEALSAARAERDEFALAEFFPDPDDEGTESEEGEEHLGGRRSRHGKPPTDLKRKPPPFRVDKLKGGFRVVRDNATKTALPDSIRIRAAYDTSMGNPFTKYEEADFRFDSLNRHLEKASEEEIETNALTIRLESDDFVVEVAGFDPERELKVECRSVSSTEEDPA